MTKQLFVISAAVMATLLSLVILWQFRIVVVYILISLTLAATARPSINYWTTRGLVAKFILILFVLVSLAIFGFLIFLVGRLTIGDIQQLAQTLSVQGTWSLPLWLEGSSFQQILIARLPTPDKLFESITGEQGQLVLPAILGFTQGVGSVVSGASVILFLSLYWSINQIHFERLWLSLLPSEVRKHARGIWRTIEQNLGAYIRSEAAQSILAVLFLGIGYWLLGSPYPALLALIGALAWLIPVIGAGLAIILALVIGLLTGVQLSLLTSLYTLVVLIALQIWVEPRFFKREWDNPILTLIILLALADVFGLLGILAAPPLSAVCQILWNRLVSNRLTSATVARVSDLNERQAHLRAAIEGMDELPPPLITSSMLRLTELLEKAEPILRAVLPVEPPETISPVAAFRAVDGAAVKASAK